MAVKFKINARSIQVKMDNAWESGIEMLASQILKDCNRYCKEDTGMLIISSYIHSDLKKGRLIWRTPYAARQYYEIRTAYKDVNPLASWRWVDVARKIHGKDWTTQLQEFVRIYGK